MVILLYLQVGYIGNTKLLGGKNYFKELEKNYRTLPLFYTDENTNGMSNTNEITNRFNPLKSSIELKNNYRTLPLFYYD
jgi:hypothetical protein